MRAEFSEFSFGYALTESLVNEIGSFNLSAPPLFPTLRQEHKWGYDLKLQSGCFVLFLQFKLCEGMISYRAREIAKAGLPLTPPFLRMNLMPEKLSKQHMMLLKLEEKGEGVYYAAPRFYKQNDFVMYHANRKIIQNSAFIAPSSIGRLPDQLAHSVSFDRFSTFGWVLSEPKRIDGVLFWSAIVDRVSDEVPQEKAWSEGGLTTLEHMVSILEAAGIVGVRLMDEDFENPLGRIVSLARQHFDALAIPIVRRLSSD